MSRRLAQWAVRVACLSALGLHVEFCLAQAEMAVKLKWEAPSNCPQQAEVQERMRDLLGTSNDEMRVNPLRAKGSIEPFSNHYKLTLLIERSISHGTRVIESDDCSSLGKAAAVILGLLVQKERTLGRELSETEISGQPEKSQKHVVAGEDEPHPRPAEKTPEFSSPRIATSTRRWNILVRAPEVTVDFLSLPRVGYGLGLGVGFAYEAWQILVSGTIFDSQSVGTPGLQRYQSAYQHRTLDVSGCPRLSWGSLGVAPCAVFTLNQVMARGSGDRLVSHEQRAFWFSIGAGISGYWHLHRYLSLVATGAGRIVTNQPEFLVETLLGSERAHKVPFGTLGTSLGCEWIF